MTKDRRLMSKLDTKCVEVVVADNTTLKCEGVGNVQLNCYNGNVKTVKDGIYEYVLSLSSNLLAVRYT